MIIFSDVGSILKGTLDIRCVIEPIMSVLRRRRRVPRLFERSCNVVRDTSVRVVSRCMTSRCMRVLPALLLPLSGCLRPPLIVGPPRIRLRCFMGRTWRSPFWCWTFPASILSFSTVRCTETIVSSFILMLIPIPRHAVLALSAASYVPSTCLASFVVFMILVPRARRRWWSVWILIMTGHRCVTSGILKSPIRRITVVERPCSRLMAPNGIGSLIKFFVSGYWVGLLHTGPWIAALVGMMVTRSSLVLLRPLSVERVGVAPIHGRGSGGSVVAHDGAGSCATGRAVSKHSNPHHLLRVLQCLEDCCKHSRSGTRSLRSAFKSQKRSQR